MPAPNIKNHSRNKVRLNARHIFRMKRRQSLFNVFAVTPAKKNCYFKAVRNIKSFVFCAEFSPALYISGSVYQEFLS
jgi:hypothetical protein